MNRIEELEESFRSALGQSRYKLTKALDELWHNHEERTTAILAGEIPIRKCHNPLCQNPQEANGYCDDCLALQEEWKQGYR